MRRSLSTPSLIGAVSLLLAVIITSSLTTRTTYAATTGPSVASGDWQSYVFNEARSGFNPNESKINATSVGHLHQKWTQTAGGLISVQAVIANKMVYWGAWGDGLERATSFSGQQIWATNVGVSPPANCGTHTLGVSSTATIATETINGTKTSVLYVGGGDVNVYALNAKTGKLIWKTPIGSIPDYYIWSSPAVYNGSVYIGVSSRGDCPLVQGQLDQLDAVTGKITHTFNTVPNGCTGASVWGSPTIDTQAGTVYFVTGNGNTCNSPEPYADAMVELRLSDLSLVGSWQVPKSQQFQDSYFGSTPTLFTATINGKLTSLLGVANKNGIYYALKRDALGSGPVWEDTIANGGQCPECGDGSISPSAWDGTTLYAAGGKATISGKSCAGSLQAINPANGAFLWQDCFQGGAVLGAVSAVKGVAFACEGNHLVAVGTTSGKQLFDFDTGSTIYSAAAISHGAVYVGSTNAKMYAFVP
jgi:outer membrane protein assembly factor BamB